MHLQQLKDMVEAGRYRAEPMLVAEAMLRYRGVRELLAADATQLRPTGRSRRLAATPRRQAA